MIEIDQECTRIVRIVEAEIQQAQISEEYEIQFGKTQEIGSSSSNPRLSLDHGRNSIRKSISNRYPRKILEISNIIRITGRVFNGIEWKHQEILIQTEATTNHVKGILIDGLPIYEGTQYTYKTFEGNNFSCKNMILSPETSNMDNRTQILLNRMYEKMQIIEESIHDKSKKLFKIRDELASLLEQARMMQYGIQLNTEQAENE
ncbi:hypothetical protein H5410_023308 [Solanum commersonii]|uniref:Uncharacterized protein n=1 Tax=Solanum commersonii TaxID=4109 RepID=A0A9J5ZGH2_SOLCO|nr:hypothetical protein H5410_023308 [Solanum commersonii]